MRLCFALALALATPALAEPLVQREQYEERLIERALAETGLVREPAPEGKLLERVEIVRDDVISDSDPWPSLLNSVHWVSRDNVIRQELLIEPGEQWDPLRVEETARNLRKLFVLSVVRMVACQGSLPDRVVLLVVTKDLWSIRLNSVLTQVGSVVQLLDTQPSETNLAGTGKSASLHLRVQQLDLSSFQLRDKAALGEVFVDPRLFGSRLALTESFDLLLEGALPCGGRTAQGSEWCTTRRPGQIGGFTTTLDLARPLYSLATEWAFDVSGTANVRQVRAFVYSSGTPPPGDSPGLGLDTTTFDPATVPPAQRVYLPRVYDVVQLSSQATATRSFGNEFKHDLSFGFGGYRNRYSAPSDFPFDPATIQLYEQSSLPRSENAVYALASFRNRDTRYVTLHDIQAFALTEDYLLGHDLSLTARAAATPGQAGQAFTDATLLSQMRWYAADDLLTTWLNASVRWQPGLNLPGHSAPWANESLELGVKNSSPRTLGGRFHAQVHVLLRNNDLNQTVSVLGGDTGLRGYPSGAFVGFSLFQINAEYRSEPINLRSLHLGLVAFYDGGSVFSGPDPRMPSQTLAFHWHQGVGVGVRGQFPQFDKSPLRADFGVPLSGGAGGVGSWFSLSISQVF